MAGASTIRTDAALPRISRDSFAELLDEAVACNGEDRSLGLLMVRVHNLNRINATFGHIVNLRVVAALGARLRENMHERDQVHQIADDAYGLILPNLANRGHAELAANKVLNTVAEPFHVGATLHTIRITVGIAAFSGDAAEGAQLLQRAELALASAEDDGTPYAAYRDATALATAASWDVEAELAEAIENGELELYFQPQLDLATDRIWGAEALMRWHHPRRGFLTPRYFIKAAERGNQIQPLTWSALNTALQRASAWLSSGLQSSVGVNISAVLLSDPEFVQMVSNAVAIWDLPPHRLTLEITETALMHEFEQCYESVKQLHNMNVDISMDDFGTGYSSFAYFRDLPARELKIDMLFISNLLESRKDRNIVESLISLAHKFDLRVVAEGVSDEPTLQALRDMNCDIAQGYYLAEPMPHHEFTAFLTRHRDGWRGPASTNK